MEGKFKISYDKSDTKYDKTKNTNIKKGADDGNGKVAKHDV